MVTAAVSAEGVLTFLLFFEEFQIQPLDRLVKQKFILTLVCIILTAYQRNCTVILYCIFFLSVLV